MWLNFKAKSGLLFLLVLSANALFAQQTKVVYNLRQNWLQYDESSKGYLPALSNKPGETISFGIDCSQYQGKQLYIYADSRDAGLFHNNVLISRLSETGNLYDIDSLSKQIGASNLFLTVYRNTPGPDMQTIIVEKGYVPKHVETEHGFIHNSSFTSYFIITSILLYAGLVLIKLRFPDLFNQYTAVQRSFNPQTIDELIYKGRFFAIPGVVMILWMSLASGLVLSFLANMLGLAIAHLGASGGFGLYINWLLMSVSFLLLFVFRYGLITAMAVIFDMSGIRNIHFASYLRLTYYLLLALLVFITLDYFSPVNLAEGFIIGLIFGALLLIIVLVGIRLSLIIRHTFVHLFLYLCGTEIFLFVFVYKLVAG